MLFDQNFILENDLLLLRPSLMDDLNDLFQLADQAIWTHSSTSIQQVEDMKTIFKKQLTKGNKTYVNN